jgi:SAM-dependent methyltransferase
MYWKNYLKHTAKKLLIIWPRTILQFFVFLKTYVAFKSKNDGRFGVAFKDLYPCLKDKVTTTPFDQHYTYHPAWAARIIAQTKPALHIDISSILSFSTIVSAFVPVKFYDYRPAKLQLANYESDFADLTQLPFATNSVASLSCMHTVEHIGLGRYGDALDPQGDLKAMHELQRVVQPGGTLLFVTPVGRPRIEFNAHRIYAYEQIVAAFSNMQLKEFSLVPDAGGLITNATSQMTDGQQYGCGCFWFIKKTV